MATDNSYRAVMGERLKAFRLSLGISVYQVAKRGDIRIDQVNAVESGETNYTIDSFLGYIRGCDLYMYFAEKSTDHAQPHDYDDLISQGIANDPNL